MRLGVAIEETWDFFHEVFADLSAHHDTTLYKRPSLQVPVLNGRVNGYLFRKDLASFLRAHDVVFFEWASELLAAASHMPKACGIVTRLHRYELYQWAERINWDAVDRVILVSEAKHREFSAAFPHHAHKATVIPEAVSVNRFAWNDKPYGGDIGILCHLKPRKRVYELVLAFHELVQARADFHLHIGGGRAPGFGDYYDAVVQLVERLGLADKVTFYGHVARPEEWYPRIDVFVSNGYSEGLQVSPMEAMATGCYALAHRWEGADELLPDGQLYDTNTELNQRLLQYAAVNGDERQEIRRRMRALVTEHFNVDLTKVQIRRIVEETAAAARAA
jgi:glycosyltransferase involved in cell wall biosynthesis